MREYRVELDTFSGPLDLLLHLVREQEVDIRDVSISMLLRGYLTYLEKIQMIDLNEATDFLVMASTLLELKSKELLPREEVDLDQVLDPRDNLVSQLLEFRRFRDLARQLGEKWRHRGMMFSKGWSERVASEPKEEEGILEELDDLNAWDLLKLYAAVVDQVGLHRDFRVERDRKPIRHYLEAILERMKKEPRITFDRLFDHQGGRRAVIGSFVALLEVAKRGFVRCIQEDVLGPIMVEWFGPEDCTVDDVLTGTLGEDQEEDDLPAEDFAEEAGELAEEAEDRPEKPTDHTKEATESQG